MRSRRRAIPLAALAAALAAGLGCAGGEAAPEAEAPAPPEPAASAAPAPEPETVRPPGQPAVTRSALLAALDRGPGALLQSVEVEAHFEDGRFVGWEVLEVRGEGGIASVDIRPGDIVTGVNGYGLERPEYLHAIFVELRSAGAIVVEGERGERPFELRVPVVDDMD